MLVFVKVLTLIICVTGDGGFDGQTKSRTKVPSIL